MTALDRRFVGCMQGNRRQALEDRLQIYER